MVSFSAGTQRTIHEQRRNAEMRTERISMRILRRTLGIPVSSTYIADASPESRIEMPRCSPVIVPVSLPRPIVNEEQFERLYRPER
jgi:hypothetical protein